VGSHTLNAISWLLPRLRKLEILNEKGLKPPSCRPTCFPLTYRSHCQSTAPKCRMTLSLCTFLFNEIVVWYHKAWSFVMRFPTPERADSIANGTNIFPSHLSGMVLADLSVMVSFHKPFKFCQLSCRTSWGRGYSGCGRAGSTVLAQVVRILSPAGAHSCACATCR